MTTQDAQKSRIARPFQLSLLFSRGVAEAALYCAHRTSTFLWCAFCEQEGHLAAPSPAGGLFHHPARDRRENTSPPAHPLPSRPVGPAGPMTPGPKTGTA